MKKIKNEKTTQPEVEKTNGLEQTIIQKDGTLIPISKILTPNDWWVLKKRNSQATILLHDAVKKLADIAGIQTNPKYSILIAPTHENNYTIAMQVEICDSTGRCTTDIGETNRSNLGIRGRANPVNMSQKRAYDRAVLRHLGITGLLSEEEIQEEEDKNMDKLSEEEAKQITPLVNEILNAKDKKVLNTFKLKMRSIIGNYNENQVNFLRELWKKNFAKLEKSF